MIHKHIRESFFKIFFYRQAKIMHNRESFQNLLFNPLAKIITNFFVFFSNRWRWRSTWRWSGRYLRQFTTNFHLDSPSFGSTCSPCESTVEINQYKYWISFWNSLKKIWRRNFVSFSKTWTNVMLQDFGVIDVYLQ